MPWHGGGAQLCLILDGTPEGCAESQTRHCSVGGAGPWNFHWSENPPVLLFLDTLGGQACDTLITSPTVNHSLFLPIAQSLPRLPIFQRLSEHKHVFCASGLESQVFPGVCLISLWLQPLHRLPSQQHHQAPPQAQSLLLGQSHWSGYQLLLTNSSSSSCSLQRHSRLPASGSSYSLTSRSGLTWTSS